VAVAAAPAGGGAAPAAAEEKTEFDVFIKDAGPKKIEVIKVMRQLSNVGLAEAKAAVEAGNTKVLEGATKEAANDAKSKLEAAGAVVELK
jgi:large subunit ribosomal protein L7/L12